MARVEQTTVLDCDLEQAQDAWEKYNYKKRVGWGRGPSGEMELGPEEAYADKEFITFTEEGSGRTRVTLTADYDPDEKGVDVAELRADVNDEIARFKEFAEKRMAA